MISLLHDLELEVKKKAAFFSAFSVVLFGGLHVIRNIVVVSAATGHDMKQHRNNGVPGAAAAHRF